MNHLIQSINAPALSNSCAARIGRQLVSIGFGLKAAHGLVAVILSIALGVVSVSAQTPSGQFFNGDSAQLGNSLRSVTFFLAAAMIIAGIIFIAVESSPQVCANHCRRGNSLLARRASPSVGSAPRSTPSARAKPCQSTINSDIKSSGAEDASTTC